VALLGLSIGIATADMESDTDRVLVAQADTAPDVPLVDPTGEAPREPTPAFMLVDAGPETGAAAEVPGPGESPATVHEVEPGSDADLAARYEALKESVADREGDSRTAVQWGAIVAALAWLLIAGVKRLRTWTDRGKRLLPLVAMALGVVAAIGAEVGLGLPWWQAAVVGGGGPLSVFLHELVKGAREVRS
jgi:hypothetical protein